jgi:uncharacterized membrane protein YphA (DoxX/SURF4 family)
MNWKKFFVTTLRLAIGWHFIYEGFSKLLMEDWSAYNYLIRRDFNSANYGHFLVEN